MLLAFFSFVFFFFFFFSSLSLPNVRIIAYVPFRVFGFSKIWEIVKTCVGLFVTVWGDAAEFKVKEKRRKGKRKGKERKRKSVRGLKEVVVS
ncbi:hypothetical protein L873DRAFT_856316 [Choiromyces venosus 120613-1]|uniref:Uncharacterized protein n=1 Tax=Choiromyces venosus 120613-1 TaxID=1336337 RepID=A0A3N4JTE2_9PEZI|nr:hypothetical protein L873DRAFT_856316 [Choiromyces venosus 120613-1]